MNPDLYLQIAGRFLTYCLQMAVAVIVCLALARLSSSPGRRFRLWLGFMAVGALYGLALIALVILELLGRAGSLPSLATSDSAAGSRLWLVSEPWKATLGVVMPAAFGLYVVVAAGLLAIVLWRQVRLHLMIRQGRRPAAGLSRLFQRLRAEAGAGPCELLVAPGLASPATAFWWKPRILVPEICDAMEDSPALNGVLRHELIHVRRRDYLWAVLSDVICGLLFFHPAVWKARGQMRVERELACDREVIAANPGARADYAESLTRFARMAMLQQHAAQGIDFAAPATFLGERVRAILAEDERSSGWKIAARAMSSVALLTVFALLLPVMVVAMRFALPVHEPLAHSVARIPRNAAATQPGRRRIHASEPASGGVIHESHATRLAPPWRQNSVVGGGDDRLEEIEFVAAGSRQTSSDSEWQERAPGKAAAGGVTIKTVLLQTAGVLVEGSREERAEHAPHKRLPGR